jgi:hypothetical protein
MTRLNQGSNLVPLDFQWGMRFGWVRFSAVGCASADASEAILGWHVMGQTSIHLSPYLSFQQWLAEFPQQIPPIPHCWRHWTQSGGSGQRTVPSLTQPASLILMLMLCTLHYMCLHLWTRFWQCQYNVLYAVLISAWPLSPITSFILEYRTCCIGLSSPWHAFSCSDSQ